MFLYNFWWPQKKYLTTKDAMLSKHINKLNVVYLSVCNYLKISPEHQEINNDLIFKPNLKLEFIDDNSVMIYTNEISVERYNILEDMIEHKKYDELIKEFGDIHFISRENGKTLINFNMIPGYLWGSNNCLFSKKMIITKEYIETHLILYKSSIDDSVFLNKQKFFKIYDLRANKNLFTGTSCTLPKTDQHENHSEISNIMVD